MVRKSTISPAPTYTPRFVSHFISYNLEKVKLGSKFAKNHNPKMQKFLYKSTRKYFLNNMLMNLQSKNSAFKKK